MYYAKENAGYRLLTILDDLKEEAGKGDSMYGVSDHPRLVVWGSITTEIKCRLYTEYGGTILDFLSSTALPLLLTLVD